MRSTAFIFLALLTACGARQEAPPMIAAPAAPVAPLPAWSASEEGLQQARQKLEQQGYSSVVLVQALPSPGTNPPYYEGYAVRGGRVVNVMVMADGSTVFPSYVVRQNVPHHRQYACQRIDSATAIDGCFGTP